MSFYFSIIVYDQILSYDRCGDSSFCCRIDLRCFGSFTRWFSCLSEFRDSNDRLFFWDYVSCWLVKSFFSLRYSVYLHSSDKYVILGYTEIFFYELVIDHYRFSLCFSLEFHCWHSVVNALTIGPRNTNFSSVSFLVNPREFSFS